jgi:hypothetical protein
MPPPQWDLAGWDDLEADPWPNLLVGNGLSISVSDRFRYDSLFDLAALGPDDVALFDHLGTRNFELVLDYLQVARTVCQQSHPAAVPAVEHRFESIRQALIEALNAHHVEHAAIPAGRLEAIGACLASHDAAWMTSYDLVAYWAAMTVLDQVFDGFWNQPGHWFDPDDAVRPSDDRTYLWWPHGAIHLHRRPDGVTAKYTKQDDTGLLGIVQSQGAAGLNRPLIVSEGRSREKVKAIAGSDYLAHALDRLRVADGPIVIFGQALREGNDDHLVEAIARRPGRRVAYGVHAWSQNAADAERVRVEGLFPDADVVCFDSATHPLSGPP